MDLVNKIVLTILLSSISGIFYRMGGSGNYPRWTRQAGLTVIMIVEMFLLGYFKWPLALCAGLLYGLSTTYFKKKGTDAQWYNWLCVGLAFSISMLPIVIFSGLWIGFIIRTIVCTSLVVIWSQINGNAVKEELGRGFIPTITLPLLLIGT